MPTFFTLAFLTLSGSQAGPFAGLGTILVQPVKTWTLFVPRSRSLMSVAPRVAAFSAAPRGWRLAKTWPVSFPPFIKTKYFLSAIRFQPPNRQPKVQGINLLLVKRVTAPHMAPYASIRPSFVGCMRSLTNRENYLDNRIRREIIT